MCTFSSDGHLYTSVFGVQCCTRDTCLSIVSIAHHTLSHSVTFGWVWVLSIVIYNAYNVFPYLLLVYKLLVQI